MSRTSQPCTVCGQGTAMIMGLDLEGKKQHFCRDCYGKTFFGNIGGTGEFPQGKIDPADEGELRFALVTDKKRNVIVFEFGKSVKWFALDKAAATALGTAILERAKELDDIQ